MNVSILNNVDDWFKIKLQWDELVNSSEIQHPFFYFDWLYSWWDCFGEGEIRIVLIGDAIINAIAPLFIDKSGCLRFIGDRESDYCGIIIGDKENTEKIIKEVLKNVLERNRIKKINLVEIIDRQQLITIIKYLRGSHHVFIKKSTKCYFINQSDYNEFFNKLKRKNRKNIRSNEKKILIQPNIEIKRYESVTEEWIREFLDIHIKRWKDKGIKSVYVKNNNREFIKKITKHFSEKGLLAYEFSVNGKVMVLTISFYIKNTLNMYIMAMNTEYKNIGTGIYLLQHILKENLYKYKIDFLRGEEEYKIKISDGFRNLWQIAAFPKTPLGMIYSLLYFTRKKLSPLKKRIEKRYLMVINKK